MDKQRQALAIREDNQSIVPNEGGNAANAVDIVQPSSAISGGDLTDANFGFKQVDNRSYSQTINNTIYNMNSQENEDVEKDQPELKKRRKCSKNELKLASSIVVFTDKHVNGHDHIFEGEIRTSIKGLPYERIAIKRLVYNDERMSEAANLRHVSGHQNIIKFIAADIFEDSEFPFIYIAMERCRDENLYQLVLNEKKEDNFHGKQAVSRSKQIAEGLEYLHKKNITHRDLKPHNVLISMDDSSTLKITDFGMSKQMQNGVSKSTRSSPVGTDGYRAPETYKDNKFSKKADVFSLGLTVFFVCSNGLHPYGEEVVSWNHYIMNNENCNLDGVLVDPKKEWIGLLEKMLEHQPENRSEVAEILEQWPTEQDARTILEASKKQSGVPALVPKKSSLTRMTPYIVVFDKVQEFMIRFNPFNKTEAPCNLYPEMMTSLVQQTFSAVSIKDTIYVLLWRKFVYSCCPNSDSDPIWTKIPPMKEGHGKEPPATVLDGCIYVCGGGWDWKDLCRKENWIMEKSSSCMEKFDPKISKWMKLSDMLYHRKYNQVVTVKDHIYCIGGMNGDDKVLSCVEKFSPSTEKWEEVAPLIQGRYSAGVASLDEKIYLFGGIGTGGFKLDSVECYDLTTCSWMEIVKLDMPRSDFCACVVKEKIFLVGGNSKNTIDVYSEKKQKQVAKLEDIDLAATIVFYC